MNAPASTARRVLFVLLAALFLATAAPAEQPARRPLNHGDYDSWRAIQSPQLSPDGKYLAYGLAPEEGDGELVVRNLATGAETRQPRGSRAAAAPAAAPQAPARRGRGAGPQSDSALAFSADSRTLVFRIAPSKAEIDKARKAKPRPEPTPPNSLGILDLATGKLTRIERVEGFQLPDEAAGFVAYHVAPRPEDRPAGRQGDPATPAGGRGGRGQRPQQRRPEYGAPVVLRSLADGSERTYADVIEYAFAKDGKTLIYVVASKQDETNGVYAVTPGSTDAPVVLLGGKGKYSRLAWDDKQTQLVFLSDHDDAAAAQPHFKLYHWERKPAMLARGDAVAVCMLPAGNAPGPRLLEWAVLSVAAIPAARATELVSTATPHFRAGFVISDRASPSFSQDGCCVFLNVAPPPEPDKEQADEPAEDKVVVDLWHYKDDFIQPMQKVRSAADRNRTYRAVYHLKDHQFCQLADDQLTDVTPTDDGGWALGVDDHPYRILVGYDDNFHDVYLVNTHDGSRKPLLQKHLGGITASPGGKYALYYNGKDWISLRVADGKSTNLTKDLGVSLSQEDHDTPNPSPPYGVAGWTKDDAQVLLYDRYDLWQVSPEGGRARNLTEGRPQKLQFRLMHLDPKERAVDPAKPLLLRAENEATRDTGFFRLRLGGGTPQTLIMAARNFSPPVKAKNADVLLLTAATFNEFPDLVVADPDFHELKKVSNANPQRAGLLWGSAELVHYKNLDGVPLSGILVKPENFDPAKKYPMIVYIYEKLSQNLNHFVSPGPGTSINVSYYASNGYLVFMPDIVYTVGHPGQSALKCVLPGIQAVVDQGFVDEKALGIQGHSWGGYQIAYMVTQTNRFKAAAAGAPVANMTSAYDGIRWGTGLPRQFQYEKTQSRIGGSLWQAPMQFIENSPIFQADRVQTPLLMLHNDNDDAVPWYQGIEYFLALRRLGKEVYLFNYNGEPHGLRKRVNQKDYTLRMQQFFDYNLKGAPKPEWMEKGIPYKPPANAAGRPAAAEPGAE